MPKQKRKRIQSPVGIKKKKRCGQSGLATHGKIAVTIMTDGH